MDLIPKAKKTDDFQNSFGAGNFIKSRGISISGKEVDLSFLRGRWVLIALAVVFLAFLCFGAVRGYIFYLDRKAEKMTQAAEALISGQESDFAQKIIDIGRIENAVDKLRQNHIYATNFFTLIEKLTLSEIKWEGAELDVTQGTADMRGKAVNYSFLAKQIINFEKEKIQISVSGISLDKDGVGFSAKLKFDAALLKKQE